MLLTSMALQRKSPESRSNTLLYTEYLTKLTNQKETTQHVIKPVQVVDWLVFIIPLPTKLRRNIVTLPSVRPSFRPSFRPSVLPSVRPSVTSCKHSRINILQWILTKLGTYLVLKRIWNPIDF